MVSKQMIQGTYADLSCVRKDVHKAECEERVGFLQDKLNLASLDFGTRLGLAMKLSGIWDDPVGLQHGSQKGLSMPR